MEHKLVMNRIECSKNPFVNFFSFVSIHLKLSYERIYLRRYFALDIGNGTISSMDINIERLKKKKTK